MYGLVPAAIKIQVSSAQNVATLNQLNLLAGNAHAEI